jgi:ceramide glucosyltransferase
LRSWLAQDYTGSMQFLFGVASADDAVCDTVRKLIAEFPQRDAQLVVCGESLGANAKVSTLAQLEQRASYTVIVISDADVRVPADFLTNIVAPLQNETVGLVNCFYRLANPATLAMRWEAVAVNADFWSSVLQSRALAPLDFALGAAMAVRRAQLREIGGFAAIADCLADDYQLGHRIAKCGHRIELSPVVVECWSSPMTMSEVWRHQLRWARTIRVCRPVAYFFSILSNATLWPFLWLCWTPLEGYIFPLLAVALRVFAAADLNKRLTGKDFTAVDRLLVPVKDLLQAALWLLAFTGNRIEWRGENYRLRRDGTLSKFS